MKIQNIGFRDWLYRASRSRAFLWKFAVITLLFGVIAGFLFSRIEPSETYLLGNRVLSFAGLTPKMDEDEPDAAVTESATALLSALATELKAPDIRFSDVVRAIPLIAPHVGAVDHPAIRGIIGGRFGFEQTALAMDFLAAWNAKDTAAYDRLVNHASEAPPKRFTNYALGRIEAKHKNYMAAFECFRREANFDGATESRHRAINALIEAKNFDLLRQLEADPRFKPYFNPYVLMKAAAGRRDWLGILKWIWIGQIQSYGDPIILVSLVAGLSWALFLFNLGEVATFWSKTTALCFAGLIAGIISTTPTLFVAVVEDDILHFAKGEDIYHVFAYFIAGVAVREELCKLLLFVPLLPFLIKRDDDLEALIVASFVGLGFAIEENGGYFSTSVAASAPGRFLTANFFHIALTGLNGLALFRACARGIGGLNQLLFVLPVSILAHGAYDALLDKNAVDGGDFIAMGAYMGFALFYFSHVHPLRTNTRRALSLTGSFAIGVSVLSATVIAFQMGTLGAAAGASLIFSELVGSAILLVLFFREFNEPLSA